MSPIIVIAHNIRSTHNIGAILRTADGLGIEKVIVSGYTPYPKLKNDTRLPHIADKNTRDIAKSALGAEHLVSIEPSDDLQSTVIRLKEEGYTLLALEQNEQSISLPSYHMKGPIALLLGEERYGITSELLALCDEVVEIPMLGQKESLNVSIAAGICLYQLRYG